jgi:hypothetical protein
MTAVILHAMLAEAGWFVDHDQGKHDLRFAVGGIASGSISAGRSSFGVVGGDGGPPLAARRHRFQALRR